MFGRTYVLVLPLVFALSLGTSIGLTFLPCYSALCVEAFYPFGTRIHLATFYGLLASIALALTARALSGNLRAISELYLVRVTVPVLDKRVSFGAVLLAVWTIGISLATTGFWWPLQCNFYETRGQLVNWSVATLQLAITGITGHYADLAVGFIVLPVARNTLLGRAFGLQQSTLLFAHKVIGYVALLVVIAHGLTYFTWIPHFARANRVQKNAFGIDNPTITMAEAEAIGPWGFVVLPSGAAALACFLAIAVTSLPKQRRVRYNAFYYTHLIVGSLFFFLICVHASTDFYCLLPGLILWLVDWATRLRWLGKNAVEARLENAGNGWYRIRLPDSLARESCEKAVARPLQAFNLNFPTVSKLQCHAFTASAVGGVGRGPTFLFRRAGGKEEKKLGKERTWKLSKLAEAGSSAAEGATLAFTVLPLRLEGPYVTPSESLFVASRVLCLVGGTGITGALSLANAWFHHRAWEEGVRFRILWTVRTREVSLVAEIDDLREEMAARSINMDLVVHVSRKAGRLRLAAELATFFEPVEAPSLVCQSETQHGLGDEGKAAEKTAEKPAAKRFSCRGWMYCSGPSGLLDATDVACVDLDRNLRARTRRQGRGLTRLDRYCARWEV